MLVLGYCYVIFVLLPMHGNPNLVSGWTLSPLATKMTTTTTTKVRTRTKPSVYKRLQCEGPLISRSVFRLYQDFIDGDNDDFSDESSNIEYFDDFDFAVGDEATASNGGTGDKINAKAPGLEESSPISVLEQRFKKLALTEQVNRQQISDNWKEGYWGVWGCSLDPYTDDNAKTKTIVTCMRHMQPSPENDGSNDESLLIVGRSDGSICWLQMQTISSQSSSSSSRSASPSDNDPNNNVEKRSVTTYFENKLVAKGTDDGGMIVDTALQRRENDGKTDLGEDYGVNNDGSVDGTSSRLPFDILAQIQTAESSPTGSDPGAAIVDMLPLPSARMVWTISHGTPNAILGWKLAPSTKNDFLLPSTSLQSSKVDIEMIHTSPIVAMKIIPKSDDDDESQDSFVVSVSGNGQVVVWEVIVTDNEPSPSILIRLNANLFQEQPEEERDEDDSVLSIDVDDQYLYVGHRVGRISIFSWSAITEKSFETSDTAPLHSLPLVKSFLTFTSRDPGVSTLLAAGPGTLGANNNGSNSSNKNSNSNRPPTKSLIAGSMSGELKQWELIPAGQGRLEYWPRMASQKLPGGKPHVYETRNYPRDEQNLFSSSPIIKELLCIQQVLLAATDHDLTVWDSSTGKSLYDMHGMDFTLATVGGGDSNGTGAYHRPSLIAANDSVLVTNGMENFVCVHDFAMDRVTSENAQDFLERDNDGN